MSRRRRNYVYPVPAGTIEYFKTEVMRNKGIRTNPDQPEQVKYEVAKTLGVPLKEGDNGQLTTEQAGKIGGQIGGAMVREMVRIAQQQLARQHAANRQQK